MIDMALLNLFDCTVTPERCQLYKDAITYLESIEYDTIQEDLLNIVFESIDREEKIEKPESMIIDEIHSHLTDCYIDQCRKTGIEVTEETTLRQLVELAIGVGHIPTYEDMDAIVASTVTDDGPIDQLAEVLHLVTTKSVEYWMEILESVSKQLIDNIQHYGGNLVNEQYAEVERLETYLSVLRSYREFMSKTDRQLKMFTLIDSVPIGQPFTEYLNTGILNELADSNQMDLLAMELYGMCLMSEDGHRDPPTMIRSIAENFLHDSMRVVKLNNEVATLNASVVKFHQQGN